eukprot:13497841-Alexandrium_andersonii.AAC.1
MPGAIIGFSINVGATRFDQFDSLLDSVGIRFTCHRVPPWQSSRACTSCMASSHLLSGHDFNGALR